MYPRGNKAKRRLVYQTPPRRRFTPTPPGSIVFAAETPMSVTTERKRRMSASAANALRINPSVHAAYQDVPTLFKVPQGNSGVAIFSGLDTVERLALLNEAKATRPDQVLTAADILKAAVKNWSFSVTIRNHTSFNLRVTVYTFKCIKSVPASVNPLSQYFNLQNLYTQGFTFNTTVDTSAMTFNDPSASPKFSVLWWHHFKQIGRYKVNIGSAGNMADQNWKYQHTCKFGRSKPFIIDISSCDISWFNCETGDVVKVVYLRSPMLNSNTNYPAQPAFNEGAFAYSLQVRRKYTLNALWGSKYLRGDAYPGNAPNLQMQERFSTGVGAPSSTWNAALVAGV